jgi:hypothetical protein
MSSQMREHMLGAVPGDKVEDEFSSLDNEQLRMLARHNQEQIERLLTALHDYEDMSVEEELSADIETALIALRKIKDKLHIMENFSQWAFTPGAALGGLHNEQSVRNVIVAMQNDLLNLTMGFIVQLEGDEIPF